MVSVLARIAKLEHFFFCFLVNNIYVKKKKKKLEPQEYLTGGLQIHLTTWIYLEFLPNDSFFILLL